ncbi:endonuclease/exonuclease/phosphatase family protein [Lutibacter flavus]|uniref:Metal-dependent hydrolase, endonuclease/exonuclease/phosphatase family n=1 Tax=Lutibacter flavus TaxID=691689 RepID=A0A238YFC3_9FLAO|nr:endonuclease/exonuclease/phosphatase family protein [Lutibacter flavus]SNR69925.1 Metal-dependent hydrolase, endonuclease/exonuclease/phosphatase family [Lutibacter flavus]
MKKYFLVIIGTLFFTMGFGQELKIMTYNIRLDVASDGENAWPNRKDYLVSQLKFYAPDIFGIQEGLPHQVTYLNEGLKNYNFFGEGRDGGNEGEYSALYYKKNKFQLEQSGTFWLSETPKKVSKGWDAALPRICTYGLFKHKESGLKFWVFNTHLDHMGAIARVKSLDLILDRIENLNSQNLPVMLIGDFNLEPNSEAISNLKTKMKDSREISSVAPYGQEGTFNSFNYNKMASKRIDYIFVSNSDVIKVEKYATLNNSYKLKYPSDHFPVFVQLKLKE